MHPYLENIHQDMNRTYDALQAQIRRSRMKSTQAAANTHSSHINNNINNKNNQPSAHVTTVPFSAILESLLNQFSEYWASQENSFQPLTAPLSNDNNNNYRSTSNSKNDNKTISTSPADNDSITAVPAAMGDPPLSERPLDLMQDDSSRSPTRSMSLDMAKSTPPSASELLSYTSVDASSTSAEMHLPVNDQQYSMNKDTDMDKNTDTNKDMDMDMDTEVKTPSMTSAPTIAVKESTSLPSLHPTDNAMDVRAAIHHHR